MGFRVAGSQQATSLTVDSAQHVEEWGVAHLTKLPKHLSASSGTCDSENLGIGFSLGLGFRGSCFRDLCTQACDLRPS